MKYLKTFESNNEIDKYSIEEVIDIFKCLIDEGFTIYQNKFSNDSHIMTPGDIKYSINYDYLDEQGKQFHESKYGKWTLDDRDRDIRLKKYFNKYFNIVVNIYHDGFDDSIIEDFNSIYDRLISCEYRCSVWRPSNINVRYHISTEESNPFLESENLLDIIN
jgi:hypothetical protein